MKSNRKRLVRAYDKALKAFDDLRHNKRQRRKWTRNHDDITFRRKAAEWLFSDGGYTMNIAQLARMKDEKLVDSYTTA